ncbi:hypothetical protein OS493_023407 [Desmophyllum pertusum]|uniref:Transmembrane protein 254 n=1 Tax=Desmophyllum pertusum TaxID=174260 RepID=A0A9X0A0P3_9CNID|nr:hypothetical protein OS493_023407 [Desmophyllum pertusum]
MAPPRVLPSSKTSKKKDESKDISAAAYDEDFFRVSPIPLTIVIVLLMILFWFVCYKIDVLPLYALGPLGQFVSYLANDHLKILRLCFRFALMAHFLEAVFAYRISRRMNFSRVTSFKWMFQTALVGFPSLGLLLRYRKDRELAKEKTN